MPHLVYLVAVMVYLVADVVCGRYGCGQYGHALWTIWFVADMVRPLVCVCVCVCLCCTGRAKKSNSLGKILYLWNCSRFLPAR